MVGRRNKLFHLKVSVDNVVSTANSPLDDFHAADTAGIVRLLATLERVVFLVRTSGKSLGFKVGEVVPLTESFDVVFAKRKGRGRGIAGILVNVGQAFNQQAFSGSFRLEFVGTPGPGDRDV